MTDTSSEQRILSASREIDVPLETIFDLIADPKKQPLWDGNNNIASSKSPRVRHVGDEFTTRLTENFNDELRINHVSEFEEGRVIAWKPAREGAEPAGHIWRWELERISGGATKVTHTYDWSALTEDHAPQIKRARGTTVEMLEASLDRLENIAGDQAADWPPTDT